MKDTVANSQEKHCDVLLPARLLEAEDVACLMLGRVSMQAPQCL